MSSFAPTSCALAYWPRKTVRNMSSPATSGVSTISSGVEALRLSVQMSAKLRVNGDAHSLLARLPVTAVPMARTPCELHGSGAVTVAVKVTAFATPAAEALSVTAPEVVPRVQLVFACPAAVVVAADGLAEPLAVLKLT